MSRRQLAGLLCTGLAVMVLGLLAFSNAEEGPGPKEFKNSPRKDEAPGKLSRRADVTSAPLLLAGVASMSLDQLIDKLEELEGRKAQIEAEQAAVKEHLTKKLVLQQQRLKKFGIGIGGDPRLSRGPIFTSSPPSVPEQPPRIIPSPAGPK